MTANKFEIIIVLSGPNLTPTEHKLTAGTYTLGRAPDCEILFPDHALDISRHHAQLRVADDEVYLQDMDSTCGTMINGHVISTERLMHNDIVALGKFGLRCLIPQAVEQIKDGPQIALTESANPLPDNALELAEMLQEIHNVTNGVMSEVGKRIVGQHDVLRAIWAAILAKGHTLLIGVPGLAKTYMVNAFSEVLGLQFNRVQFTPDLMPTDIIGSNVIQEDAEGKRHFEFNQGPIFTQLLLADEINRTPPKTQAALLEAMQEGQVTVGKKSLTLPRPFNVIATQNPIEQEGTYQLPEAQKDRFMICCILDYPEADQEIDILLQTSKSIEEPLNRLTDSDKILKFRTYIDKVAISRELAAFTVKLVRATRPADPHSPEFVRQYIDYGAGPRAGQAILKCAKAFAAMDGRPAISGEDITDSYLLCLRHRVICNYKARADKLDEDKVLLKILEHVGRT